jgi:hypothetical protein
MSSIELRSDSQKSKDKKQIEALITKKLLDLRKTNLKINKIRSQLKSKQNNSNDSKLKQLSQQKDEELKRTQSLRFELNLLKDCKRKCSVVVIPFPHNCLINRFNQIIFIENSNQFKIINESYDRSIDFNETQIFGILIIVYLIIDFFYLILI